MAGKSIVRRRKSRLDQETSRDEKAKEGGREHLRALEVLERFIDRSICRRGDRIVIRSYDDDLVVRMPSGLESIKTQRPCITIAKRPHDLPMPRDSSRSRDFNTYYDSCFIPLVSLVAYNQRYAFIKHLPIHHDRRDKTKRRFLVTCNVHLDVYTKIVILHLHPDAFSFRFLWKNAPHPFFEFFWLFPRMFLTR